MSGQTWLRTWKRKPGSNPDSYAAHIYKPGPWHLEREERSNSGLSWCGKRPGRTTMNIERRQRTNPPEVWVRDQGPDERGKDKVCSACCTALALSDPRPYRYTGKGHRR